MRIIRNYFVSLFVVCILLSSSSVFAQAQGKAFLTAPQPFTFTWNGIGPTWQLGATMYVKRNTILTIRFLHSSATWANILYAINPVTRDTIRIFGFEDVGQHFKCPRDPVSGQILVEKKIGPFPEASELVFALVTINGAQSLMNILRYTGLNNQAAGSQYSATQDGHPEMEGVVWAIMHEATAAQINALGTPCKYDFSGSAAWLSSSSYPGPVSEDGVIFAYEDGANNTYDDMVFFASGVSLSLPERLTINTLFSGDTIPAGTDLGLWLSAKDNDGNSFGNTSDSASWELIPFNPSRQNPALQTSSSPHFGETVILKATQAYEAFTIKAAYTYTDTVSGVSVTLNAEKVVYVRHGPPAKLSIEAQMPVIPSSPSGPIASNLQNETPIDTVYFDSARTQATVFAVLRDKEGNFTGPAPSPLWAAGNSSIALVVAGTAPSSGLISRAKFSGGNVVQFASVEASSSGLLDNVVVRVENKSLPILAGAYTLDADADGYLDGIVCIFSAPVSVAGVQSAFSQGLSSITSGNTRFMVTSVLSPGSRAMDSVVTVSVVERTSDAVQTSWTPEVNLGNVAGLDPSKNRLAAVDSVAPVLMEATYSIGTGLGGNRTDTLVVTFSENAYPVDNSPTVVTPFELFDLSTGSMYSLDCLPAAAIAGARMRFLIEKSGPDLVSGTPEPGDSIWIRVPDQIADIHPNVQNNSANIRRAILVKASIDWQAEALSPFIPGKTPLPVKVPGFDIAFGTVIAVHPSQSAYDGALVRIRDVSATVYDPVGNIVAKLAGVSIGSKGFLIPWDGRNTNGRLVGSGTYLAIVKVDRNDSPSTIFKVKICAAGR